MGSGGKDAVAAAEKAASDQMADYTAQARAAKGVVEKQKQEYKDIEFKNPYADMQNPYAGMENTFEDVTVNQQQAQFQAQQGAQQRSNIMQGLRGAAGSSGVAGLAQAMANQGQLATQQIGASIGQQESAIQRSKAQEAGRIQTLERQGEGAADLQRRQGEAMVQQAETGRVSTLLGMEYGELQAAQAGKAAAYQNQQNAAAMELERVGQNKALTGQIIGSVVGGVASGVTAGLMP